MRMLSGKLIYSPSDLIRYLASPFASWMDRLHFEQPGVMKPDEEDESMRLIAQTGIDHERAVLAELQAADPGLQSVMTDDFDAALATTLAAINANATTIYQAALRGGEFAGLADFIIRDVESGYQIWDTKLARSPRPYYAIQLCCYSEMFAECTKLPMPRKFGIILGNKERIAFSVEDFIHYYREIKKGFLALQNAFTGDLRDRPEPLASGDHGRWFSYAEQFFRDTDHLVQVAGISVGQIKKLEAAGISTMAGLAAGEGKPVKKLAPETFEKLVRQARLQSQTLIARHADPAAPAQFEVILADSLDAPTGLASLPAPHDADVFFDMEGYPLAAGGLEYLFGVCIHSSGKGGLKFLDWWGHDRAGEKAAFEGFIDWVSDRWRSNPGLHIYHYAAYEVSAVRRLSIRHNTRQDEVDQLLRHEVFVDLYQVVRQGLCVGEGSYSIKSIEHLYRDKRATQVATAADSIVEYARWIESQQSGEWSESPILKSIRDYNEDDCRSTEGLLAWLRSLAEKHGIPHATSGRAVASAKPVETKELEPEVIERLAIAQKLAARTDSISLVLADVIDFHRREQKPMWWRMFDRAKASIEELRDDAGCVALVEAVGKPETEKQSLVQHYTFDPAQECKLAAGERAQVMFTHNLEVKLGLIQLDTASGDLRLKLGKKAVDQKLAGSFPTTGSLIPYEYIKVESLQLALSDIGNQQLARGTVGPIRALIERVPPAANLQAPGETTIEAAIRVASQMNGGCLVIQGPPGTGKTYTAAAMISALLAAGKKIGITSGSHKAVINLLAACGKAQRAVGQQLRGLKVGGDDEEELFADNPGLAYVEQAKQGFGAYSGGVVGGTAWLFSLPDWEGQLDFLFVDEAGQVSLANTIATARSAKNIILLGDQMQLEQPIQGAHPGESGLSGLQYALKDLALSKPDDPIFHAVVPADYGLFLGESRRMHPAICSFISESVYEGRLGAFVDCGKQRIAVPPKGAKFVQKEKGIFFSPIEHDGNIQQSDEEVARVLDLYRDMIGRSYTASNGKTKPLAIEDFLFISPYNAQVRALRNVLPADARVGSIDKFQGQEAPVCILSLCSSYGEYGSRGLGFILDRNRVNVAISRAQCLAIVVADPRIATTPVSSLADMKLVNLFCKLAAE